MRDGSGSSTSGTKGRILHRTDTGFLVEIGTPNATRSIWVEDNLGAKYEIALRLLREARATIDLCDGAEHTLARQCEELVRERQELRAQVAGLRDAVTTAQRSRDAWRQRARQARRERDWIMRAAMAVEDR